MTTEIELHAPTEILDFSTGELIPASDTQRVAEYLAGLRNLERGILKETKEACVAVLLEAARAQGTKTLRFGKTQATIGTDKDIVWDMEVLEELREAGLPEERWNELVQQIVTYKVSAAVAKQIAGANPEYADIIGRARTDIEKGQYVSVKTA